MNYQRLVFLSAEHKTKDDIQNFLNTNELRNELTNKGFKFNEGMGYFEGHKEVSFMVFVNNNQQELDLIDMSRQFNQDSVLVQTAQGISLIHDKNDDIMNIGRLVEVSEEDIKKLEAYSVFNGRYFAAKQNTRETLT